MPSQLILSTGDLQFSDGSVQSFAMGRNKIINGNFAVNQRAVSGTVTLSAGAYGHDRFKAGASGCTYTFATSNNVTTLTISAGSLQQVVEGNNLLSGTHVLSWSGTAQGKIDGGSYSASGVTGTATGGTNMTVEFGTGTLSKVQLEQGSAVSQFEMRPYSVELALCQRYYWISGSNGIYISGQSFTATATYGIWVSLPVRMRAVPTVATSGTWSVSGCGQPYCNASDQTGFTFIVAGTGTGNVACNATGSTFVSASAEL